MTNCLVKSISSQVDAAISNVNKEYLKAQAKLDRKMLEAAKARGLLNFPLAQQLLSDATNFLTKNVTGLTDELGNQLDNLLTTDVLSTASLLAIVGVVSSTLNEQLKAVVYGSLVEALKNEVRARLILYRLVDYHINQISNVLQQVSYQQPSNLNRLRIAYNNVVTAQKLLHKFASMTNPPATGRLPLSGGQRSRTSLISSAFSNIEMAKGLLVGDTSTTKRLINSKSVKDFTRIANEEVSRQVLERSLFVFDALAWNISRLVLVIPVPVPALVYKSGFVALPGTRTLQFNSTPYDRALAALKSTAQSSFNATVAALDLAKGLVPTNLLATQLMQQLIGFGDDWVSLSVAADTLVTLASPALPLVDTLRTEMQEALENKDPELVLMGKEAQWIIEMEALLRFKQVFSSALQNGITLADNAQTVSAIYDVLVEYERVKNDDAIISALGALFVALPQAPFSYRALAESKALCAGIKRLLVPQKHTKDRPGAIQANEIVRLTLDRWDPTTVLSGSKLFGQMLNMMNTLPAPGSTIARGLMTGQIGAVVTGFNTIIAMGGNLYDNLSKLAKSCDDDSNGLDDALISEVNNTQYDRGALNA